MGILFCMLPFATSFLIKVCVCVCVREGDGVHIFICLYTYINIPWGFPLRDIQL